ncbi:MAG: CocE/NonD family hydrolase [Rhodospirillales bacterium]|nr:CocE/NonD family hydrolase [Rhodospirillales bacterium]
MSDNEQGGSYHPGVEGVEVSSHIPSSTGDRFTDVEVRRDVMVAMADGTRLCADVYLPKGAGKVPAILTRHPYGKNMEYMGMAGVGDFLARKGYAYVCQDVRGRFGSEGVFDSPFGRHEIPDGFDTIEWITGQDWSDGTVGMWGESYYGLTSYCGAIGGHPALKCIAPGNPVSFELYDFIYRQGALPLNAVGTWALAMDDRRYNPFDGLDYWTLPLSAIPDRMGQGGEMYKHWVTRPERGDSQWRYGDFTDSFGKIAVPTLLWGGWYDNIQGPWMADWLKVLTQSPEPEHKHMMIGPWDHEGFSNFTGVIGPLTVGKNFGYRWDTTQAFFDHYLMGLDNGFEKRPRVEIFVLGDNAWRFEESWPLRRATDTGFYLGGGGRLDLACPDAAGSDSFVYDPANPVTDTLRSDMWAAIENMGDRRATEARDDVLSYTSAALDEDMEITGHVRAELHAASSAVDTDFTVSLVDVFEDGYAHEIQHGIIRASHRDPESKPSPIEPGRVYAYAIDLWWTSYVVKRRHRLRVEVSSSRFNEFDRNLNSGEPQGEGVSPVPASQTIHHSAKHPSRIILPIVLR